MSATKYFNEIFAMRHTTMREPVKYYPRFRYYRDINNAPRVTECRIVMPNADNELQIIALGIAVCSYNDPVVKHTGRMIALRKAHENRRTGIRQQIRCLDELYVLEDCGIGANFPRMELWLKYVDMPKFWLELMDQDYGSDYADTLEICEA